MSKAKLLAEVKRLADEGKVEEAWNILEPLMLEEPNHGLTLAMGSHVMHRSRRYSMAYYLAREAVHLEPGQIHAWVALGHAAKHIWQIDEAMDAFRQAIQLTEDPKMKAVNFSNIASCLMELGQFKAAEPSCLAALKLDPTFKKARINYGICLLARREWKGWDYYSDSLETPQRLRKRLGSEPDWTGAKGQSIVIRMEQGMGDEINFASMFPDAIKDCSRVVIECEGKLEGLLARSFPQARVYGTRRTGREAWDEMDLHPDASIVAGELGKLYRTKDADFTGLPYLLAEPGRRIMWRALFDSKQKPVIGIAWSGGTYDTGLKVRRFSLEQLLPVLSSVGAHWVSLQYQDATQEIEEFTKDHPEIDLVQYPYATLTPDYDDTAALVAELDLVVCMQTCVGHLAGALGKEAMIFIPERSLWRYGEDYERMLWYRSVRLYREKNGWDQAINKVADELSRKYRRAVKAA